MTASIQLRVFLLAVATTTATLGTLAHAQALVDGKDAQAAALGYVADAERVDIKKFPNFAAGQNCANCARYQGEPADEAGGCPLVAGEQVEAEGWCSAWAKKA